VPSPLNCKRMATPVNLSATEISGYDLCDC
jgi:hypothetical protein